MLTGEANDWIRIALLGRDKQQDRNCSGFPGESPSQGPIILGPFLRLQT